MAASLEEDPLPNVDIKGWFLAHENTAYFHGIIHFLMHTYVYYIPLLPSQVR